MSMKTQSIVGILRKEGRTPDKTSVVFSASENGKEMRCMTCGIHLAFRQHRILRITDFDLSEVLKSSPVTMQCRKCGHIYVIHIV